MGFTGVFEDAPGGIFKVGGAISKSHGPVAHSPLSVGFVTLLRLPNALFCSFLPALLISSVDAKDDEEEPVGRSNRGTLLSGPPELALPRALSTMTFLCPSGLDAQSIIGVVVGEEEEEEVVEEEQTAEDAGVIPEVAMTVEADRMMEEESDEEDTEEEE